MTVSRTRLVFSQIRRLAGAAPTWEVSDGELLARFVACRDQAAFSSLMERHGNMVLHVCARVLHHAQDAEDAFQGTFLLLAQKAQSILNQESVASWLYKVAYRLAIELRTSSTRRQVREMRVGNMKGSEPGLQAAWQELQVALDDELFRLPARYQAPLVLCYLQGKTHEEAARQLACPLGTINSRLARARELLKKRLARRGLALPAATLATVLAADVASAVPGKLLRSTCTAALAQAAGQTIPEGLISAQAAALTRGGLSTITATHLKIGMALILILGAAAAGAGAVLTGRSPNGNSPSSSVARADASSKNADSTGQGSGSERLDRNGDPLPDAAATRVGSSRFVLNAPYIAGATLTFTNDSKQLAVSGQDFSITMCDAVTGRQTARIGGQDKPNWYPVEPAFAFSPDDKLVAIAVTDGKSGWDSIQVWDVKEKKQVNRLTARDTRFMRCLFAPDGKSFVAAGGTAKAGNLVYRWDTAGWSELPACEGHKDQISAMAFSPDSKTIVTGSEDQTVSLWDADTGKLKKSFLKHRDRVVALAVSPDGKRIASRGNDAAVRVWDANTGEDVHLWNYPTKAQNNSTDVFLRFGSDGKTLIVGNTVRFSNQITPALNEDLSHATSKERGIDTLDIASGALVHHFAAPDITQQVVLSPDGKLAASAGGGLHVWDAASNKPLARPVGHDGAVVTVAFSPDGKTVATGGTDNTIRLWDAASGAELKKLTGHCGHVSNLCFSSDGRHLASATGSTVEGDQFFYISNDRNVSWWDVASGKELRQFPGHVNGVRSLALSSDDRRLTVINAGGARITWDTETGEKLATDARTPMARCVTTADGRIIAFMIAAQQGPVRLWDTTRADDEAIRTLESEDKGVMPAALSPDGRTLLVTSPEVTFPGHERDFTMQFWNVPTATLRTSLQTKDGPRGFVPQMVSSFSNDSRSVAVAYRDGVVAILELATSKEQCRIRTGQRNVTCLAFSADGGRLATGSTDGSVLVWDLSRVAGAVRNADLNPKELEAMWASLADDDAAKGFKALETLAASCKQAAPFLRKRIPPITAADQKQINQYVADLGSDDFDARKKAQAELAKMGWLARPAMVRALKTKPSLDVSERINAMLLALEDGSLPPDDIRLARIFVALESAGTADATGLLKEWAGGASGAWLTEEAKASLKRIETRK